MASPAPNSSPQTGAAVDQAKEKLGEIVEFSKGKLRAASEFGREQLQNASEILKEKAPELREQALEIVSELEEMPAMQLKDPDQVQKFGDVAAGLRQLVADDESFKRLDDMPAAAVVVGGVLALVAVRGLDAILETWIADLLHTRSVVARLSLLAAIIPGYAAAFHFEKAMQQEKGCDLYNASQLGRNARRLPTAFWAIAAVSATVTIKAASEVAPAILRRLLNLRRRTLVILLAVYAISKPHRRLQAARVVEGLKDLLPQHMGHAVNLVFTLVYTHAAPLMQALAAQAAPLVRLGGAQLEQSLKLAPGTLVREGPDPNTPEAKAEVAATEALRGRVSSAGEHFVNLRPVDQERN